MPRGLARTTVAALAAAVAASAGAARGAAGPAVRGPATVVPGRVVVFRAQGFHAGSALNLVVSPADKASCCAVRIPGSFLASESGEATLRFRLPPRYVDCTNQWHCAKVAWRRGQRAVLTVFGYLEQATATTLIAH